MIAGKYDIIISGAGAAGLSLVWQLLESAWGRQQTVLLVDRDAKEANDRTWGYWSAEAEPFDALASWSFSEAEVITESAYLSLALAPYRYRVLEGSIFYQAVRQRIRQHVQVRWLQAEIQEFSYAGELPCLHTSAGVFQANHIFNSAFLQQELAKIKAPSLNLMQHFKGWTIETARQVFTTGKVRLFDFRTPQLQSLRFMYVIPQTPQRALVEYTLFSESLLPPEAYVQALEQYIGQVLGVKEFAVKEEEWGIIPMTNHAFPAGLGPRIWHIGSVGGASKTSTGYTFRRIQAHSRAIVQALEAGKPVPPIPVRQRFALYDAALLNILAKHGERGQAVMGRLFARNPVQRVFRFLDEETSLQEELQIMNSVQRSWFIRSLLNLGLKLPF